MLRAPDVLQGTVATADEVDDWEALLVDFMVDIYNLARPQQRPKAKEQTNSAPKSVEPQRVAAQHLAWALDKQLRLSAGLGLGAFKGSLHYWQAPYTQHTGKVLSLTVDEGSPGFSMIGWLLYLMHIRLLLFCAIPSTGVERGSQAVIGFLQHLKTI